MLTWRRLSDISLGGPDLVKTSIPGRGRWADIYLSIGNPKDPVKAYVASVDLGGLGKHIRWQRLCGNVNRIWIVGKAGTEPIRGIL